ncbi:MAG: hypothetical protein KA224_03725 [Steroidobacteraceae bacterium]|nr:hypothetical protein [Steroidobacteraceae bacterium]MCC7200849.1 hypothetical protein [Gammaproteobacteria bacterium]
MPSALELLNAATVTLVGSGNIKQRLVSAYREQLVHLDAAPLPRDIRDSFEALTVGLTRVRPLAGEDAVTATVRKMSIEEADRWAATVVALLGAVHRSQLAAARPAAEVVSLYPAETASLNRA